MSSLTTNSSILSTGSYPQGQAGALGNYGGYAVPIIEPPKPKYPGHHCKSYAELRTYLLDSTDTPQWVKTILREIDEADPWASEMWTEVFHRACIKRVTEIDEAARRLTAQ